MLPCPFCGCRDVFVNQTVRYNSSVIWANGHVICTGCGATGPRISVRKEPGYQEELTKLIEGAWNFSGKIAEEAGSGDDRGEDDTSLCEAK
jgi:hypothetical protein